VSEVVICVKENQKPWDEFITIVFEALNSKSESQFVALCEQAKTGSISRAEFAKEVMRNEFEAVKAMRGLIRNMKLTKKEASESWYYTHFMECPSEFEAFLSYTKKVSPKQDPIKEYEAKYDALRKPADGH
jgi:hypothetical protein